jgi:hypothetical protein
MTSRHFALIAGAIYVVVGILGFIPALLRPISGGPEVRIDAAYGALFGLFPVNALHSLVHLGIGIWGLLASRALAWSRTFAGSLAVLYGALAVMGLIPGLNTVFGLIPLFGHDVWLHALTAVVAAYFALRREEAAEVARDRDRRAA